MNGFKIYQNYKENEIHYKIFYKQGGENLILELVLSYPDIDIWGENNCQNIDLFINRGYGGCLYYKRIQLHRDTWSELKNYSDFSMAVKDFNNAIDEFKNIDDWHNFKNEVNLYLINETNKIIKELKNR